MRSSYKLGGVSPVPWLSSRKKFVLGVLICLNVAVAFLLVFTPSIYLAALLAALVGSAILAGKKRSSDGTLSFLRLGERLRSFIGTRARWDDFDPELDPQPWLILDPLRVLALPAANDTELAILEYPEALVGVLEVSAAPHGVRSTDSINRSENQITSLHRALAEPSLCVQQIDWVTVVRKETADNLGSEYRSQLRPNLTDAERQSAEQLPRMVAAITERFRSYAVVRFSRDRLFEKIAQPPFDESTAATAAHEALSRVARLISKKNITVVKGLSPAEVTALTRAILDPDHEIDDVEGCEGSLWSALPSWQRDNEDITTSSGWHHATATIALDDWPLVSVFGRWLEPVVFGGNLGPRTIVSQLKVLPRYEAKQFAKDQLTTAASKRRSKSLSGEIDAGEAVSREAAAYSVAQDIAVGGSIGVIPSLRFLVSSKTRRGLKNVKEELANTVTDKMHAEHLTFDSTRPGAGLLRALPIGLEVPQR